MREYGFNLTDLWFIFLILLFFSEKRSNITRFDLMFSHHILF